MTLPVDLQSFKKHAVIIGASGSGKTVAAKHVIEELVLSGVKVIAIDPQGDLASMALSTQNPEWSRVSRRVYTPASKAGRSLSLNPLTLSERSDPRMISAVAENIVGILGYDTSKGNGKEALAAIDHVLVEHPYPVDSIDDLCEIIEAQIESPVIKGASKDEIDTYEMLVEHNKFLRKRGVLYVQDPPKPAKEKKLPERNKLDGIISMKNLRDLIRRLNHLRSGSNRDLYCSGQPVSVDELTKASLSVVYLNTLYSDSEQMSVVAQIATSLYDWMLHHPSDRLQVVLYIDEIGKYLPAGTKNTAAKEALRLLFKQGRKYGVGVMLATQNPGDVDYRAMAQAGTWMIGLLRLKQDINKVKPMYANLPDRGMKDSTSGQLSGEAINDLPHMDVGQFQVISPDNWTGIRILRFPMPRTPHETLDEYDLEKIV